jgi:hypothetical protein
MSPILSSADLPDPEGPSCTLNHLVSLFSVSILAFIFSDAIMFDSISTTLSFILVRLAALLSLNSRAKSGSKSSVKVTFAASWEGLTSNEILLYNLLNF